MLHQLGDDREEDAKEETPDEEEDDAASVNEKYYRWTIRAALEALLTRISSTWRWKTRVITSIKVF